MIITETAPQLDSENPWPGLASFEESAHAFFFGRTEDTQTLLAHVLDTPVTVLNGSSGLGKTSLLQAGLFPELRARNFLPIYVRLELKHRVGALSQQLHQAVRKAIRSEAPDTVLPSDEESLWEYLHRKGLEIWSAKNQLLTPVMVIDQFEEIFTLGERVPELVDAFREELGDLAENRIPASLATRIHNDETVADQFDLRSRNFKLLISLREDYLAALDEWCGLIPVLSRSRVRLHRLPASQALEAVHEPAAHLITADLAHRVVSIVAGKDLHPGRKAQGGDIDSPNGELERSGVEPALLSLFCRELNEMRKRRGLPRFDEDLVEEAQEHTLANYYLSCVRGMQPRVARFIESELITETGFRDRYIREDAVPRYLTDDELEQLIQSRLLRLDEDRYGAQWIELTHDVLTDVVREHREVARTAELEAEKKRQQVALDKAKKRARVLVALLAVAVVAIVVAAGLGIWAYIAQGQAKANLRAATAQKLLAQAQGILSRDEPGEDVQAFDEILAARALMPSEDSSLYTAVTQRATTVKVITTDSSVNSLAYSTDGSRIVSVGDDKMVRLWDARTGRPIREPLKGHSELLQSVAFSPDGKLIASAGDDHTVRLWDAVTGQSVGSPLVGHAGSVLNVAFSRDGHRLVTTSMSDGTVRLWNVGTEATGKQTRPLVIDDPSVITAAFRPDGRRLATAGVDGTIRLWDTERGRPLGNLHHGEAGIVMWVAFSPDGHTLASAGWDKTVRLWDADTGEQVGQPYLGHTSAVSAVVFSPDGTRLATAGLDNTVRLWDVKTSRQIGDSLVGHVSGVSSVMFSSDGKHLASSSWDGTVRIWDADVDAPLAHGGDVNAVGYSPDGQRLATLSFDGSARLWNPVTGQPVGVPIRYGQSVDAAVFSPDSRRLAIAAGDQVALRDSSTGRPIGGPLRHGDVVMDVEFSPDGQRLASAGADNAVRLWDANTGRQIGGLMEHTGPVYKVVFSPDGNRVASRSGEHTTVRLWNARTGRPIGEALPGANFIFSPDGDRLAVSSTDNTVRLWDVDTGQSVAEPLVHTARVRDMRFSPDGHLLATASEDGTVRMWDGDDGRVVGKPIRGSYPVSDVVFSPDGDRLASVSLDNTVRLWNPDTGDEVGEPLSHTSPVSDAEFSPNGDYLATSSDNGTIRLWDTDTSDAVGAPLKGHNERVTDIAFSPDGSQLASASVDDTVRLWPAKASPETLCSKLTQNMTRDEWRRWVSPKIDYDDYQPLCKNLPVPN
ncbi:WD40 repeat domain-containing protein [Mycobacterium sp. 48b]|uniref:WD40 repeat domain-containing protein n=1 Tax=Mycobacterium sp. 48b TaxID=3400426 RepID=UPI003AAF708B